MILRKAQDGDLPALLAIYNDEIVNGTATFDITVKDEADRRAWMKAHSTDKYPLLVAEWDGQAVGYATLSPYRDREAYSGTVESSVYVDRNFRRRGVGRALMEELLRRARMHAGLHCVIAVITSDNAASIAMHEKLGFVHAGTIPDVGRKFGRYLGITNLVKIV